MSSTIVHHGQSPDDYGLDAVARHNAQVSTEYPDFTEDVKGLGIYPDPYTIYSQESYVQNPPTPRSNTGSDGVRTRSGRSARRTDSPFSTSRSRVTKSPAVRAKKEKKSKLDKSKTPRLTAPLSVLTKDMATPVRDIEAWVNRSVEERVKEVEKRNGYVTRPMNSFMLYRSAYAERTKQWCTQNNHQIVSSVSGESWPMEPEEVRNQFDLWAKTERQHHHDAHPTYKFSPSKAANKRRKGEMSDDEDSDLDIVRDPDGEYRGTRNTRQRRQQGQMEYLPDLQGFSSTPYYEPQQMQQHEYHFAPPQRPLPSNVYNQHVQQSYEQQYVPQGISQYPQHFMHDMQVRAPTPASLNGQQMHNLGSLGMPGGQQQGGGHDENLFTNSRTSTPMQQYSQYPAQGGQLQYQQQQQQQQQYYQPSYPHSMAPTPPPTFENQEHAAYLQHASQPQVAIDPSLGLDTNGDVHVGLPDSHFDDAIAGLPSADFTSMAGFYESSSPTDANATLGRSWSPGSSLR
ncbi:uncharacterized protein RCC_03144 [Ramularia collo-cygni]|uniref:HMG box domain-containing protein n=1 Tax=Ramularia collo-cygni TaxID=112498 RepID=A0A2D3UW47_9PEZI|nr:uncharacterized protein RCC_03144 [Ramularia collo-cygni]CZT17310.1 uncharacterized protein RCC_03144 [Ramularia collo-cygni]